MHPLPVSSTRSPYLPLTLLSAMIAFPACSRGAEYAPWRGQTERVGDTTVVRTVAGAIWPRPGKLEPVQKYEPREGRFLEISGIAFGSDGGVIAYDRRLRALFVFDRTGEQVARIGGERSPIESDGGIVQLPDGRLVVRDPATRRAHVLASDGRPLESWTLPGLPLTETPLYADTAGNTYFFGWLGSDGDRAPGLFQYSAEGIARDTIRVPLSRDVPHPLTASRGGLKIEVALPFTPLPSWTLSPAGNVVTAPAGTYAIEVHARTDSVLRMEREVDPVVVTADEREAEIERITAEFHDYFPEWQWPDTVQLPELRPPHSDVIAGSRGQIWLRRSGGSRHASRAASLVHDVFDAHGRYLGEVIAPSEVLVTPEPRMAGDTVLAVVEEDGRPQLVLFEVRR